MKIMKKRFIVYFGLSILLLLFFGIFMICFCGIYKMSQSKWIAGSFTTLIYRLSFIKVVLPIVKVCVLHIALKRDSR